MKKILSPVLTTLFLGIFLFLLVPVIQAGETPWPMFQHDARHTARSPFVGPGSSEVPEVKVFIEGESDSDYFGAPAIGSDNTIYLAARITKGGTTKGGLYAFSPDGNQKWYYPTSYYSRGMPALSESTNTVYALSHDGILAIDIKDGNLKWRKGFSVFYSDYHPIINNGTVYFNAGCSLPDGTIDFCLISIGEDGLVNWIYAYQKNEAYFDHDLPVDGPTGSSSGGSLVMPAIGKDGTIYFGNRDTLYAFNPDGTNKWQRKFIPDCQHYDCRPEVQTPSIADDGTIYVVVRNEKDWASMTDMGTHRCLHAINPENPYEERWAPKCFSRGFVELATASNGNLYCSNYGWGWNPPWWTFLYVFDPQGNILTNWPIKVWGTPGLLLLDKEEIIYGLFDNTVKAFDQQGTELWSLYTGSYRNNLLSLNSNGTLYAGGIKRLYTIGPSPQIPETWSFAIITDLHIGYDMPDYDGYSYDDTSTGQDYYLSKRLEAIIDRINDLKDDYNIKFITVLGDISDTAEYSELLKARDILNKLNDPDGNGDLSDGIPYIPLIGNHDVWPYTQKEGVDPDERGEENQATIANSAIGDEYFEGIFWCSFDTLAETKEECLEKNKNPQKITEQLENWHRDENAFCPYLQNYAFSYNGLKFLTIDGSIRWAKPESKWGIFSLLTEATLSWGRDHSFDILFSHIPRQATISFGISWFPEKERWFAGHIHKREENDNERSATFWGSVITESVREEYKNVIRIVQIKNVEEPTKEDIDYSKIEGISEEIAPDDIKRPDPYIVFSPSDPAPNEEISFAVRDEVKGKDIKSCKWDFGDDSSDYSGKCAVSHSYSPFLLWRYTATVTITYTDETQRISKKSLWVKPKFKLKIPEFIIPNLLFDETINVAQTPQNTPESVLITKTASPKKPVGIINVHFEEITEDLDLSSLIADIDLTTRKSILHMPEWPEEIEKEKVLFIPFK